MVECLHLTAKGKLRVTDLLEQADWRIHTPLDLTAAFTRGSVQNSLQLSDTTRLLTNTLRRPAIVS